MARPCHLPQLSSLPLLSMTHFSSEGRRAHEHGRPFYCMAFASTTCSKMTAHKHLQLASAGSSLKHCKQENTKVPTQQCKYMPVSYMEEEMLPKWHVDGLCMVCHVICKQFASQHSEHTVAVLTSEIQYHVIYYQLPFSKFISNQPLLLALPSLWRHFFVHVLTPPFACPPVFPLRSPLPPHIFAHVSFCLSSSRSLPSSCPLSPFQVPFCDSSHHLTPTPWLLFIAAVSVS